MLSLDERLKLHRTVPEAVTEEVMELRTRIDRYMADMNKQLEEIRKNQNAFNQRLWSIAENFPEIRRDLENMNQWMRDEARTRISVDTELLGKFDDFEGELADLIECWNRAKAK